MKKQEIMEGMLRHPDRIYQNARAKAGDWSKYPDYFRIVRLSYDGTSVIVRGVRTELDNFQRDEDGKYLYDGDTMILDTRPIAERVRFVTYNGTETIPFRMVAESGCKTEGEMIAHRVAHEEKQAEERRQWQEESARKEAIREGVWQAVESVVGSELTTDYYGDVRIVLSYDQAVRLTEFLSSVRVAEGV